MRMIVARIGELTTQLLLRLLPCDYDAKFPKSWRYCLILVDCRILVLVRRPHSPT